MPAGCTGRYPARVGGPALFRETQRFHANPWARFSIAAVGVAFGMVSFALRGSDELSNPLGFLGLGLASVVLLLLLLGGLETEVRADGLYVRFLPLRRKHRFGWQEIASAEARTYRPIREYGGWGIRWSTRGKAYNVHGDRGLQLVLADGRRVLIGSQRADELAAAIALARGSG